MESEKRIGHWKAVAATLFTAFALFFPREIVIKQDISYLKKRIKRLQNDRGEVSYKGIFYYHGRGHQQGDRATDHLIITVCN